MLYVSVPTPVDVTVMVPVAIEQVGCVTLATGVAGVAGCAFTTAVVAAVIQPAAVLMVTL